MVRHPEPSDQVASRIPTSSWSLVYRQRTGSRCGLGPPPVEYRVYATPDASAEVLSQARAVLEGRGRQPSVRSGEGEVVVGRWTRRGRYIRISVPSPSARDFGTEVPADRTKVEMWIGVR